MTSLPPGLAPGLDPSSGTSSPPTLTPEAILPREVEEKLVKDAEELIDLYFDQNRPVWETAVEHHNLYHSKTDDIRSEEEKLWRAHIFPPRPQIITESKTAVLFDIITSGDPLIQAEGIEPEDEGGSYGEKLLSYFMRGMKFRKKLPPYLRNISIQGTEYNKLYFGEMAHVFEFVASPQDLDYFTKALMDAKAKVGPQIQVPDPVGEPRAFEVFRQLMNAQGVKIPVPPLSGKRKVRVYRGPMLDRISLFDVWLDPAEDDIKKQPAVIHRLVQHERWWRHLAGPEPEKPFDAAKVEEALREERGGTGSRYGQKFTTHRQYFYDIMGISPSPQADPIYDKSHEGFECYFGTNGVQGEYPYVVILNGVVINKNPTQMPFMHGQTPIFAGRNLVLGGLFHGISDYSPLVSIFMENASFRNLRLDGAKLSMLPIIAKLASIGMPALMKQLKPGMVVNVPRLDAFGQLFKMSMPEGAWREPADLDSDIQRSSAVFTTVEGSPATVGRVSATENQSRFNSAISRIKLCAAQIEEDHEDFAFQCLGLAYQYLSPDDRLKVGGPGDPYLDVSKDKILEAMEQDYRFLGATKAINRELVAQKLLEFGKTYAANLTPVEMRVLMADVIDSIGTRNSKRIVSDDGTRDAKEAYQIKEEMAKMQAAIAKGQLQQQAMMMNAPGTVSGATAGALGADAGAPPAAPIGGPAAPPAEGNGEAPPEAPAQ